MDPTVGDASIANRLSPALKRFRGCCPRRRISWRCIGLTSRRSSEATAVLRLTGQEQSFDAIKPSFAKTHTRIAISPKGKAYLLELL